MLVEVAGEIILPWLLSKIINVGAANHDVGYITRIGLVMVLVAVCMAVGGVLGAWFAANAAMLTCVWIYLKRYRSFHLTI